METASLLPTQLALPPSHAVLHSLHTTETAISGTVPGLELDQLNTNRLFHPQFQCLEPKQM